MSHGAGAAQEAAAAQATTAVSAAANEALVAPLLQLARSAQDAKDLLRLPRALELYERALALAETSFPQSTLLIAKFLAAVISARTALAVGGAASVTTPSAALAALQMAAWRSDVQLQGLSQRCLGLLRTRWRAGTLLTLTPEEACFAAQRDGVATPEALGVETFVSCAADAIQNWQRTLLTRADDLERLHGVHEALYPKTYKLCGRCRGVAYCGAAHCAEDWKRHKREDGCAAPP